jgi:hypothetical protein
MSSYSSYNKFKSFVKTEGLATGSKFNIILPPIEGVIGNLSDLSMQCEIASLPGTNIMTSEIRTFGETTELAYGITYPPINLTFFVSNKFDTKKYFEGWQNVVFNRLNRCPGYYDNYAKPITIIVSDKSGKTDTYKLVLHEAYPKSIQDISLSYSDSAPIKLSVMIQYKWWSNNDNDPMVILPASKGFIFGGNAITSEIVPNLFGGGLKLKGFDFGGDIGRKLSEYGPLMGSDIGKSCNKAAFAIPSLTTTLPNFSSSLSDRLLSFGSGFGSFGGDLVNLGRAVNGAIGAPTAAIAGSISTFSGALSGINSLAGAIGIDTGLDKSISQLNGISGRISQLSQLNGIPGQLQSLGASVSGIQDGMEILSKRLESVPGATTNMVKAISEIGNKLGFHGSNITSAGSALSDQFN